MSLKVAVLIATLIALVGGGITVWVIVQPGTSPAGPLAAPASDAERAKRREKFFGGDRDRDIRSGQEMKPRW
ncbi:entry exclusion protein TrbK [Mesorhizobium sp. M2E.F.Ca.ET.209.01.1.1]|uniref:entry exclusion protein TrbK n=1 Tax=Mesorhizobium sp. M2E.F.Ca.ET.209.01.1.1 TaxID=2500526 RepID=UPI000FDB0ADC|nr:entry exclusion protein TrbK [Mesorhizobium sp. M2E.F.Ca.ET.209.01.1.1]TGS14429.1 entry exclusion protein TrbK [Mesorhizobium sp. M2E.F.Ca.ET.209.01.1.1]